MSKHIILSIIFLGAGIALAFGALRSSLAPPVSGPERETDGSGDEWSVAGLESQREGGGDEIRLPGFTTDLSKATIDVGKLISGGVSKDGIPALTNPQFVSIAEANVPHDDTLGVLVVFDGEPRYYPYNILVWHEIVNDQIGNTPYAVTFCPLCGSAIVFDRRVLGDTLEFGVSGFLFESNLVMYDRTAESLWSQARGESIAGSHAGTQLGILPMQLLSFAEVREKHPGVHVLSTKTGHFRDYRIDPYGNYEEDDRLFSPISVRDERFPLKEIMYVFRHNGMSIAFPEKQLPSGARRTFEHDGLELVAERHGGEVIIQEGSTLLPGYFEMWFSWATHHQEDGIVWPMRDDG